MVRWCIAPLLFATLASADYYVDNANKSVVYTMAPSQSGLAWQTFSVDTQALDLSISNSTGNYTIPLDASHCYDQNYALGVCGTNDNCFVQIPFRGSGITMYVFNAGFSGMTASFSVDGGPAVSNTVQSPPPPTYQVPNVSMYSVQGLQSGNHTMVMTITDWNGSATSMKFDYAYINETFVAPATPTTTSATSTSTSQSSSQTPTQTSTGSSSASHKVSLAGVIGGTLGGVTMVASVVIGIFYLRKRRAQAVGKKGLESSFHVNPFSSDYPSSPTPPAPRRPFYAQHVESSSSPSPFQRSAILRDALVGSGYIPDQVPSSQSTRSEMSSPVLQPLRRQPSYSADTDPPVNSSASHVAIASSPFSDADQATGRYSLTTEQLEVIERLRADRVPAETIARVVEGFASVHVPMSARSIESAMPPPSYKTRLH